MRIRTVLRLAASVATIGITGQALAQNAGITGHTSISGLPTPNIGAGFQDLSGDGTTIAGIVRNDATTYRAYRITAAGYEALPGVSGHAYVLANGASDNGTVIAGLSAETYSSRATAVVWEGTTLTTLAHLNPTAGYFQASSAFGISGDGTVVVGSSSTATGATHAVRWVNKGNPQDLNGGNFLSSIAQRASRDGSVIVGYGGNATYGSEAFVWTAANGMTGLGVLPADAGATYAQSRATDVSADGTVAVGFSVGHGTNSYAEAFRWTRSGGMTGLGLLSGGQDSRAYAVNANGSVIVGSATRPSTVVPSIQGTVAFRWTSAGGLQPVVDWLAANGVTVGNNTFTDAKGVSDDGNVIIGTGQINGTTQQYIARVAASTGGGSTGGGSTGGGSTGGGSTGGGSTGGGSTGGSSTGGGSTGGGSTGGGSTGGGSTGGGSTGGGSTGGSGFVGLVDYLYSVAQSGGVSFQDVINAARLHLFGAHHRPLMDFAQAGKSCGWITGDYAGSGRNNRRNASGEVGICHDFGEAVRVGFGGGADRFDLDLALGGRTKGTGWHLVGEIDVRPAGTPLLISVTGVWSDWQLDMTRAYQNGTGIALSHGQTDARSWALRGRVDWRDMVRFGKDAGFSPYVAYTHGRTDMDGFTETGGAFPLAMADVAAQTDELRLGGVAGARLSQAVRVQASGEWVHRFNAAPVQLSGTILGVGGFAVAAPTQNRDWGRAGLDLDAALSPATTLSLSGHVMIGQGEDARLGGSASLRFAF